MMDYKELVSKLRGGEFERDETLQCTPFECGAFGLCKVAATAIETLLEERKAEEWVGVKDRLPSDEESGNGFICMTSATGSCKGVIALKYKVTTVRGKLVRRWMWYGRISPWEVTHWMKLPEPPCCSEERGDTP